MGGRCTTNNIQYSCFLISIIVLAQGCFSLNPDGVALLDFQARVSRDPNRALTSWNSNDNDPCSWSHVHCVFGHVQALDLKGLSLEGVLAPELGNLTHLRRLILSHNHFSGVIPKELEELKMLEVLDLRDNNFIENIPPEIERMRSLKFLLLYDNNNLEGTIPIKLENLNFPYKLQFDHNLTFDVKNAIGFINRKIGFCIWLGGFNPIRDVDTLLYPFKKTIVDYIRAFQLFNKGMFDNSYVNEEIAQHLHIDESLISRKLVEEPVNLASKSFSSGSNFLEIRTEIKKLDFGQSPSSNTPDSNSNGKSAESETNSNMLLVMIGASCGGFLLFTATALFFTIRNPVARTICPKSGLARQLQKTFVTGVQKLNRTELETACEGFSNIIQTMEGCTLFKGTLSDGLEICVASTTIARLKDWSKHAELGFHKKIETLSRINHKNFVNLVGYCEEDEPFVRMLVFEYAPNGSLAEHLHVQELEHLDWRSRMRIIMGVAYCLRYMHDLSPPVVPMHLNSDMIYLTDDYAAKVADLSFWKDFYPKWKISGKNVSIHPMLPPQLAEKEKNIYSFGVLLLEIISGKHPYSEKLEPLVTWAEHFLKEKKNISHMIDPTLKSFKQNELEIVCEVIQECIQKNSNERPNINEIILKLNEVLGISPEQATPKLSPLWWAELELLSGEGT